jgi:hypothetical protein
MLFLNSNQQSLTILSLCCTLLFHAFFHSVDLYSSMPSPILWISALAALLPLCKKFWKYASETKILVSFLIRIQIFFKHLHYFFHLGEWIYDDYGIYFANFYSLSNPELFLFCLFGSNYFIVPTLYIQIFSSFFSHCITLPPIFPYFSFIFMSPWFEIVNYILVFFKLFFFSETIWSWNILTL